MSHRKNAFIANNQNPEKKEIIIPDGSAVEVLLNAPLDRSIASLVIEKSPDFEDA